MVNLNCAIYLKWMRAEPTSYSFGESGVEAVPDDMMDGFTIETEVWVNRATNVVAKAWRTALMRGADRMYQTIAEDIRMSQLRYKPRVHVNYYPSHDSFSPGQLWFFYKQENNGNTFRISADLDADQMVIVMNGPYMYEPDKVQENPHVHVELMDVHGNPVKQNLNLDRAQNFVMPVGKHRGKLLKDLPKDYLEWFSALPDGGKIGDFCKLILTAGTIETRPSS